MTEISIKGSKTVKLVHTAFTRKIYKGLKPCDYDPKEKLIEVEFQDGHRRWYGLDSFFGVVIGKVKDLFLFDDKGGEEKLTISGVDVIKVKRTEYIRLIFQYDLPF